MFRQASRFLGCRRTAAARLLDANTNSVSYSCPAGDLQKMQHDFDAQLRKAGYQNITPDDSDAANPALTARKGSQWIHWSANTEDGATEYSLTLAASAGEKFKAETCVLPPLLSTLKQCEVEECNSKSEDSVAMRTAPQEKHRSPGTCRPSRWHVPPSARRKPSAAVEGELKNVRLRDSVQRPRTARERHWATGANRQALGGIGKCTGRRIGLLFADRGSLGGSVDGIGTRSRRLRGPPVPLQLPSPSLSPAPTSRVRPQPCPPATHSSLPSWCQLLPPQPHPAAAPPLKARVCSARNPFSQVPIEPTHDRIYSVAGDVVINMLVDVNEDGSVTNAVLTGRITKDVRKLESAAMDAVSHWRFEPARQDGRVVPAVKIAVEMHFHGRPWRF